MDYLAFQKEVLKSKNKDLVEFFECGIGVHHAGMLRADRGLTERLFSDGLLKVMLFIFQFHHSTLKFADTFLCINVILGTCLYGNFGMGCKSTCSHCCD